MFNILQEWLTCKLGTHYCLNLNFNNVGERFKDGFLFALLFQKYQIMPEKCVHVFKKSNHRDVCLNNIKSINLWLQFMQIIIEDSAIHEIAHGQSLAVTKLLYKLYFKLEMSKEYKISNNINLEENQKLNNDIIPNVCKNNGSFLSYQKELKDKEKPNYANHEKYCKVSKLFSNLDGIPYTAIDVLKSINCINAGKDNDLKMLQHNMNSFYDLFIMSLNNSNFFKNEFIEKSDELLSTVFDILHMEEENNIKTDNNNFMATKLDNENIIQNIDLISQENLKNESSTFNSLKTEESIITQELNEFKNEHFVKQDIFNDYLQHTGSWSSEYLNLDQFEFKQNILSMIIKEVLNFEYGISEIKFINIKKTNVAGVIDTIHSTKMVKFIKDNLRNKGILGFTAENALSACLKAYNEEMKISINKSKLYQVVEEYENPLENASTIAKNSKDKKLEKNSDYNENEVKKRTEGDSISSESVIFTKGSNISAESIYTTNKKLINKLIQTPENIPEPDYNNPVLSSMANLGKIINEKQKKNHDLQIGDQINCIGEYIKLNHGINGWILLQFPVQPLQMALLEFMLTGKMPYFGKEICEKSKKKSNIVPEYQDSENMYTVTNTYLTNCIKIINHTDEINSEKLNDFLQFYNQQNSIQIQIINIHNIIKEPKKAADILVGLILNEENVKSPSIFFKPINIHFYDDDNNSIKSDNDEKQISAQPSITSGDKTEIIETYEIANQFQILSTDLGRHESNLTNYTFTALYLSDIWKTMEHNYIHKIKELLNNKDRFFKKVRTSKELSIKTMYQTINCQSSYIMNLIHNYENKTQNLLTVNYKNLKPYIFELQTNLWDEVDSELEKVSQCIKNTIDELWILKNNTLISTYNQLLETEIKRAITTLSFLNRYYVDINETKIKEFEFHTVIIDNNGDIDTFQTHCLDTISKFKKYVFNYYKVVDGIDQRTWTISVQTETNRFINQVHRIKASLFLDIKYFEDLTSIDHHLKKIHTIYQFKINDVNKLCELLESTGINTEVHIKRISGQFFINKLSVFEIICRQVFDSKNKFKIEQLRSIVNKLLDCAPTFKIEITNFIDILNKLCKIKHIYPKKWPIDNQFYNYFNKELFGSSVTTIDWRDFVVQCMELPYPTTEQLLFYRKLFQDYEIGNETITIESYDETKLWFENEFNQNNDAKWLLYDMYQVQDGFNYSAMLLAFCRDKKPWIGLEKSFSLIFGWNPFDLNNQHQKQSNYKYEESKNYLEYVNTVNNEIYSSESFNEEFIFDQDIMTWFLLKNFKLYMDSKDQIGDINIPKIVKSIFINYQTQQVMPTVDNLFKNNIMYNLYKTVHKFQTKKLSEVAKNVALKYYDLSSLT